MATARTADAVAICAAGGKKICDDRLPLRRLMQSSGKRLLPRLGVSATNSPIPQHGRTVDVRWQSPGPGRGQIRLSTPATLGGGSAHCNNQSLIWHTRTLLTMLSARIFSSDREGGQSKPNAAERFEHVFQTVTNLELGAAGARSAVNQLPKSVGAGNPHATFCGNRGGRPPPVTRCRGSKRRDQQRAEFLGHGR